LASAQTHEALEVLIPFPTAKPLHPPLKKEETNDTIMATTLPPRTHKRPHESDNLDSDKEAPSTSTAQDYVISSDNLAFLMKVVEPTSSSGWIDVCKKKCKKEPSQ